MASSKTQVKNPDEEASGAQLYRLNELGLLTLKAKPNANGAISKGVASDALSKAKDEGLW
jgi:hypothetical protein